MRVRPSLSARVRAVVDKLDDRMEHQTQREGADAPHCVATVGAWQAFAGALERKLDRLAQLGRLDVLAAELRLLRRVLRDHAVMVNMQGARIRAARRATVQRAIQAAKRGAQ